MMAAGRRSKMVRIFSAIWPSVRATDGLGDAYRVGYLDQHLVCDTGCYQVLGDIAGCVCRRAVYLAGILAGEGSAAVGSLAAVGVHDDLAAGQAGVAVGASDDEFAGGVYMEDEAAVEELTGTLGQAGDDSGNQYFLNILADTGLNGGVILRSAGSHALGCGEVIVLCGYYDSVHPQRPVVVAVLDGELGLGVRAEVGHGGGCLPADLRQLYQGYVGQCEWQGHVFLGIVAGVAEHHALVAGTLLLLLFTDYTPVDVGGLLVHCGEDAAGFGVEHVVGLGVADLLYHAAGHVLDIHVCV